MSLTNIAWLGVKKAVSVQVLTQRRTIYILYFKSFKTDSQIMFIHNGINLNPHHSHIVNFQKITKAHLLQILNKFRFTSRYK